MQSKYLFSFLRAFSCFGFAQAQVFVPGNTYFGKDNYIEYYAGNAPLIISVPHGGYTEPAGMPDRDCTDCAYVRDAYTQELSRLIQTKFFERTGCYPHMIYNLLHRKKLDMNRELLGATDTNASLDVYWNDYHRYIDSAKAKVQREYNKGLFVDMHGHGHTKQRIEIGYLVSKTTLGLADSLINLPKYTNYTSIRSLVLSNLKGLNHVALLKGPLSMGTLLDKSGYPSVPSSSDPYPLATDEYFNGGYNTVVHGSNTSGKIDAIQFELYSAIRFDSVQRKIFADSLVNILINYLNLHYFTNYSSTPCASTSIEHQNQNELLLELYPNPCSDFVNFRTTLKIKSYRIVTALGQDIVHKNTYQMQEPISLSQAPAGMLYLFFYDDKQNAYIRKIVKQ